MALCAACCMERHRGRDVPSCLASALEKVHGSSKPPGPGDSTATWLCHTQHGGTATVGRSTTCPHSACSLPLYPHRSLGDLGKWLAHFQILFETGGMWLVKLGTVRLSLLTPIPSRSWARILHCSLWEWLFRLHFFFNQLLTLYVQNKNHDIIPQYPTCTKITDLCCFSMSYSNSFGKAM